MQKVLKSWKLVFVLVFSFALASIIPVNASSIAAPTLLKINDFKSYSLSDPVISGVTPKNTNVLVYVDDVFAGNATVKDNKTASDSFYFQFFNLSVGRHSAYLVAEDKTTLIRSKKSNEFDLAISSLPAPTLVVPNKDTITAKVKPLIEGFSKSGSFVHLYIDGVYNGKTKIVEHISGTAHFVYVPFLNLNVGKHKMWAISEDLKGRKSLASKVVEFNIEEKMPAPTLYKPVANSKTVYNLPYIVGLAKNNSKIRIFIDHKLDGEFKIENHDSGTGNFAYKPNKVLKDGKHLVYATSLDRRGKESIWSNIIYFDIVKTSRQATISEIAAEESLNIVKQSDIQKKVQDFLVFADLYENDSKIRLSNEQYQELEDLLIKKNDLALNAKDLKKLENLLNSKNSDVVENVSKESKPEVEAEPQRDSDIADIIKKDIATNTSKTSGLINEDKKQQDKLGWNAVIFILFLVSVIAWIFWVNRELIKEKKQQEEKND